MVSPLEDREMYHCQYWKNVLVLDNFQDKSLLLEGYHEWLGLSIGPFLDRFIIKHIREQQVFFRFCLI